MTDNPWRPLSEAPSEPLTAVEIANHKYARLRTAGGWPNGVGGWDILISELRAGGWTHWRPYKPPTTGLPEKPLPELEDGLEWRQVDGNWKVVKGNRQVPETIAVSSDGIVYSYGATPATVRALLEANGL